ncbi:MAG: type I-E CRISPR-associated endonuclease Cas1 [Deltaproteobacteria bacterium]|nr:type I-E CRISPR-associated endonuclease Cas1 [Deltaproteobacteria bacterium]
MATANLRTLARFTDSLSFLYLEHAVIEKEDQSVAAFTTEGRVSLPAANLSTLMLGPGTRITHAAIQVLSGAGCVVAWVGEDGLRHYAAGQNKTRSSAGLERQCLAWAEPGRRMATVRLLYEMRFRDPLPASMTLQQIRGREGARVRDAYRELSQAFGVDWSGRAYRSNDWSSTDPVNRAISASNAALYAVTLAAVHALGYSPALGFIHTGKQLSFIYDLADVYKMTTSVPAAFEAAASTAPKVESRAREMFRQRAMEVRLLDQLNRSLVRLFGGASSGGETQAAKEWLEDTDSAVPGARWDPSGNVPGGVLHAGDDS